MTTLVLYGAAAIAEIAGCFAFWAVVRDGASAWWLAPGLLSFALFGWLLTRVDIDFAGHAYAVYGGIYMAAPSRGCGQSKAGRRIAGISCLPASRSWALSLFFTCPARHKTS